VAQVQVVVNNVAQNPSSAYTISSNTITFTSAPSSGTNNIYVYYTSPITQVIAPSQGTVTTNSLTSGLTITTPTINQITSAAATALTLQSAGTTAVTIDTSQNVGVGVTPSGWSSSNKALQVGVAGAISAQTSAKTMEIACNAYNNGGWKYIASDYATHYYQYNGTHVWEYASSGTAGNAVTFNEAMRIDTSGRVTQPYQPAFFAKKTNGTGATITGTLDAIPFNATDFNIGSCFNTSTYRFTAPVSGTYFFTWNATSATTTWNNPTPAGNTVSTALYKNGTVISATDNFLSLTNSGHRIPVGGSTTIYLTANDYVSAGIPVAGGQVGDGNGANSERLSFSGYLIG
jgi:hypothetical protein